MMNSNRNISHPLIPNANEYFLERKYVSINAIDRNIEKYPHPAQFEIELPQDLENITSCRLANWSFPSNNDIFSINNANLSFVFQIDPETLYVPPDENDPDLSAIYEALNARDGEPFLTIIEPGFYNPIQMSIELTNKMNGAVTLYLQEYLSSQIVYDRFQVVYNEVGQKLWFGNYADGFTLTNSSPIYAADSAMCARRNVLPSASGWGLPYNIGFSHTNVQSIPVADAGVHPRFYYTNDLINNGDQGNWLEENALVGGVAHYIQAENKINFMGPAYIYMEMDDFNCIDETSPYNISRFTHTTNSSNGKPNSAFAKIGVLDTPISQFYDESSMPYKYFNPPMTRLTRLKLKFRYHTGELVDFSTFDYSIMLEFTILRPQPGLAYNIRNADGLGQVQSK